MAHFAFMLDFIRIHSDSLFIFKYDIGMYLQYHKSHISEIIVLGKIAKLYLN